MKKIYHSFLWLLAFVLLAVPATAQNKLETPADFFGFKPGADRQLFTYEKLIDYFKLLDEGSIRLKLLKNRYIPHGKAHVRCHDFQCR